MKIAKIILLFSTSVVFVSNYCLGQKKDTLVYSYKQFKSGTSQDKNSFLYVVRIKKSFIFYFKGDTTVVYLPSSEKPVDTLVSSSSYGPYRFKKRGDRILFCKVMDKRYKNLYILKADSTYLIPDILSVSADSYFIQCRYLGDTSIRVANREINCYKFYNYYIQEGLYTYRIVYISKKLLIPMKIDFYQDDKLNTCNETIYCENGQ